MDTRPAAPPASSIPRRLALLARVVVPVALCAGFVSGSCTAQGGESGMGTAAVAALTAAGIALAVGLLFLIITRDRRELRFFTLIGIYACIARRVPGLVGVCLARHHRHTDNHSRGIAAGRVARSAFRVGGNRAANAGFISACAITIAAAGVVAGFWLNIDIGFSSFGCCGNGGSDTNINLLAFVPIAGGVPPLMSAIGAWLAGLACRQKSPLPGSSRDAAGAGHR